MAKQDQTIPSEKLGHRPRLLAWFEQFLTPDGFAQLKQQNWTLTGVGLSLLGIVADLLEIFGGVTQLAFIAVLAVSVVLAVLIVFRSRLTVKCAVPMATVLVLVVGLGILLTAQKVLAANNGLISKHVPVVAQVQQELFEKVSAIYSVVERTESKVDELGLSVTGLNDNVANLPKTIASELLKLISDDDLARAREAGIENRTLARLVDLAQKNIDNSIEDPDVAIVQIEIMLDRLLGQIEKGELSDTGDETVDAVMVEISILSKKGSFEEGSHLAAMTFELWRASEADRQNNALQNGLRLLDVKIEQDQFAGDFKSAARGVLQKVELEQPDALLQFSALEAAQIEWHARGRDKGLNLDLEVSIEVARLLLELAEDAEELGNAYIYLGNSLSTLGQFEIETRRLEDAVAAYRLALEELSRGQMPLQWAVAQNNLGIAFSRLGMRENGTDQLEAAIVAYRLSLAEWPRNQDSLRWAMVQSNLAGALSELGELEAAIVARRAALEALTRDQEPIIWAKIQFGLGSTLLDLGLRGSGTDQLKASVVVYRVALEELTRDQMPLIWALGQNGLGTALLALGQRESGTDQLEAAVVATRRALEVLTREQEPFHWVAAQNSLGSALGILGQREGGTDMLEEAVIAFQDVLEVRTRERVSSDWAQATGNQGAAKLALAERKFDCAMAQDAAQQMQLAFEVLRYGGHGMGAATFELQLPQATALVTKLCG